MSNVLSILFCVVALFGSVSAFAQNFKLDEHLELTELEETHLEQFLQETRELLPL